MKLKRFVLAVVLLLSVGGAVINRHLTAMHTTDPSQWGWFAEVCSPEVNPAYDCEAVLKTKWGAFSFVTFSFVEPDPLTGEQPGVPVALLGWMYFSVVFVWYALVGSCSYARRSCHLVLLLLVGAGCVASLFFIYITIQLRFKLRNYIRTFPKAKYQ